MNRKTLLVTTVQQQTEVLLSNEFFSGKQPVTDKKIINF